MRVCVIGCGAVGSLFAANLATLEDVEVWAYDLDRLTWTRSTRTASVSSGAGELHSRPRATADAAERAACDFGIVATKAMHTAPLSRLWPTHSREGAVASVQNGVGNEEVIAGHVERRDPGNDLPGRKGARAGRGAMGRQGRHDARALRAEPGAEAGRSSAWPTRVPAAGMPAHAVGDARPAQWRKVIFNAATNPVGALTGLTHGRVCERPDLRALVSALVDEGKAVAAAQGIVLDADPEELIDHAARPEVAYGHKASMLQDVEAHRATEVDFLNGGIARFGRELGVPTPLNTAVAALVKGLEASWR